VVTPALPGFAAPVPSGFPATKEAYVDWHDAVDAIARPGLVLRGADDPYVTADFGERLARRTHARLVMFPDSGHWWPATKPAEVATALETLWSSTPS
jgi:pimeloyl-ACP methyl ester carboxylesterase